MKKELLKKIKKIIKDEFTNECDLTSDTDTDLLFNELERKGIINFSVVGRTDFSGDDYWLELHYYSKKLQKTVIMNCDVGNFDNIDEVADFIIRTSKELVAFEKSIKII